MATIRLHDEPGRIAALRRLNVLDTPPERQFDHIVQLVRNVIGVPMAAVSLVDERRQWFKAQRGMAIDGGPRESAFCNHTIRQEAPLVVSDATADARFSASDLVQGAPHIRGYAGVPLTTPDGYNVGALCAIDTNPRTFTPQQVEILVNLAELVCNELELRQIATSDEVTGALSRRGFLAKAVAELEIAARDRSPAAMILLDIDHFKQVNDRHGHPAGDIVLRELVARCAMTLRRSDHIGRIGGEEFAVLLPRTTKAEAILAAERLRTAIARKPFAISADVALPITISLGVASAEDRASVDDWLASADRALYAAKHGGRNMAVHADAMAA